ncbi:serine/threonine protein kinase [Nocardia yamanashiensis]|uniref:serine/threonine-protein kinase n=1 Tax=Nocardia yamanashiensis TaxID=209247 RepID=UPI001E65978D|nr:serine/threonine-protein kinase [Nocardia yamanashiensis]UGT45130.1 serine/threonine protein kinase [Nocardia yamanashiensis]
MRELASGTLVAGYRIERRIGSGATGAVYLARHPRLPRNDALKVRAGGDLRFRERFRREARLASRLDHPHVVSIYDSGECGETLWIAMQFIDGSDAGQLVRAHRLPADRAIDIVLQAARGLDAAHAAGLLHRDVKPANILVANDGRALVADFGIARESGDTDTLAAGMPAATLAYAAPEQLRGGGADHRADVYGLGATLYHLLTGRVPYPRETAAAMVHAQLSAPPPRPCRIAPELPVALDAVIARALAKDPTERYGSCGELAEAARATLGGRTFRRTRRLRLAAGLTVAASVAATATAFARTGDSDSPVVAVATTPVSTIVPATSSTPVSPWGSAAFIADTFPNAFTAKPSARGYLGLTCTATDDPATPAITCNGSNPALSRLTVTCRTDRETYASVSWAAEAEGSEKSSHGAGSGTAVWRTVPDASGASIGNLEVRFDSPDRHFCALDAYGATGGRALFDGWWQSALI